MSSSTHPLQVVQPGEAVARRAAEILAEMDRECDADSRLQASVRERQLGFRAGGGMARTAQLGARAEAIIRHVPSSRRHALRATLEHAAGDRDEARAEQTLERVERDGRRAMRTLATQRALMEHFAANIPGAVQGSAENLVQDADGALHLIAPMRSGGRVRVSLHESHGDSHRVTIDTGESGIDMLATDRGTLGGCAAQEEFVARICANVRVAGAEVIVESSATSSGRAARPEVESAEHGRR